MSKTDIAMRKQACELRAKGHTYRKIAVLLAVSISTARKICMHVLTPRQRRLQRLTPTAQKLRREGKVLRDISAILGVSFHDARKMVKGLPIPKPAYAYRKDAQHYAKLKIIAAEMRAEGSELREIAEKLGVNDATVSRWTRHIKTPAERHLVAAIAEAIRLRKLGWLHKDIAEKVGYSQQAVSNWTLHIPCPNRVGYTKRRKQAFAMHAKGFGTVEIAKRLGVNRDTVYKWFKKFSTHPELKLEIACAKLPDLLSRHIVLIIKDGGIPDVPRFAARYDLPLEMVLPIVHEIREAYAAVKEGKDR